MKRARVFAGILFIVLVLGLSPSTALSPSNLCWGAEENGAAVLQQITQHLKTKAVRMSEENLNVVAQTVFEESLRCNVDYRLVLAIIKVESNYRPDVVSRGGSRGLMQIHPSLAKGIAKEAGVHYRGLKDLYDPRKNIRLGTHYISKLMDLFNDIPTAIFAYSVGHHKAKRLLSADKSPRTPYTKRVIAEYRKNTKKMVSL
ncbi:MAG TPA: lytic transglycosylase domain-containing protein [Syntrophales bacterium]|jgi:soluble lytic murein transglycosylase|nr:lytic transglycosylase domain-containing protein [Syntrophales bacterium]HQA83634.1 lytic transglycosylase domain-containing protein [Syntrophales bacterium]